MGREARKGLSLVSFHTERPTQAIWVKICMKISSCSQVVSCQQHSLHSSLKSQSSLGVITAIDTIATAVMSQDSIFVILGGGDWGRDCDKGQEQNAVIHWNFHANFPGELRAVTQKKKGKLLAVKLCIGLCTPNVCGAGGWRQDTRTERRQKKKEGSFQFQDSPNIKMFSVWLSQGPSLAIINCLGPKKVERSGNIGAAPGWNTPWK